ncbi:hypothetical protein L6452_44376 [Arctium lappa]|uniref:Uncharacterized protein n=1 Tax=Arctium lappa TaxID=4217 RepID=A0ACB8XG13_ARCLA|nr:hypothetical protein L6452_44376 [Arctium lappa]
MDFKNENKNNNNVSFFKILLNNNVDYLPLPPSFAKKYLNKNQTLILKTKSTLKWKVKYIKIEDRYYFIHGWLKFINDNHLQMGDFLVFWLLSPSMFEVFMYAPNGCLKTLTTSCSGGGKNDKMLKLKKVSFVKKESSDDDFMEDVKQSLRRVITKNCVHKLPMTKSFVKAVGINGCCRLRLKNDDGKVWEVKVKKYGSKREPIMTTGWINFKKDNKIQIGDLCEFNHVKANLLHVHIFKKGKQVVKKP